MTGKSRSPWIRGLLLALLLLSIAAAARAADVNPVSTDARGLYLGECARCHGRNGQGDGPDAPQLHVRPHSFMDCDWMSMMSDATLYLVIKDGGASAGFTSGMPAYGGKLDNNQIESLLQYVRSLCSEKRDRLEQPSR